MFGIFFLPARIFLLLTLLLRCIFLNMRWTLQVFTSMLEYMIVWPMFSTNIPAWKYYIYIYLYIYVYIYLYYFIIIIIILFYNDNHRRKLLVWFDEQRFLRVVPAYWKQLIKHANNISIMLFWIPILRIIQSESDKSIIHYHWLSNPGKSKIMHGEILLKNANIPNCVLEFKQ